MVQHSHRKVCTRSLACLCASDGIALKFYCCEMWLGGERWYSQIGDQEKKRTHFNGFHGISFASIAGACGMRGVYSLSAMCTAASVRAPRWPPALNVSPHLNSRAGRSFRLFLSQPMLVETGIRFEKFRYPLQTKSNRKCLTGCGVHRLHATDQAHHSYTQRRQSVQELYDLILIGGLYIWQGIMVKLIYRGK